MCYAANYPFTIKKTFRHIYLLHIILDNPLFKVNLSFLSIFVPIHGRNHKFLSILTNLFGNHLVGTRRYPGVGGTKVSRKLGCWVKELRGSKETLGLAVLDVYFDCQFKIHDIGRIIFVDVMFSFLLLWNSKD